MKNIFSIKMFKNKRLFLIPFILIMYWVFVWIISDPARAGKIDRSILYNIDDIFKYCYARIALVDPKVLLNPNAKPVLTVVFNFFLRIFPNNISTLRAVNSLFSAGLLCVLYKFTKELKFEEPYRSIAVIITAFTPIYFLASISTLAGIMFTFFLLSAVYLYYTDKNLCSAFIVSFLPIIRQEGILYLGLWVFFLFKKNKLKYTSILFIPSFIWSLLDYFILGNTFGYPFFYIFKITSQPPIEVLLPLSQIHYLIILLICHPLSILFLLGYIKNIFNKKYKVILLCSLAHVSFLFAFNGFLFFTTKSLFRDLRFLVPLIPFMAILSIDVIKTFIIKKNLSRGLRKGVLTIICMAFIGFLVAHIGYIQKDPRLQREKLTLEQENEAKMTSKWLNQYLEKNGFKNVYISGELMIHPVIRRLWMDLPIRNKLYLIWGDDYKQLNPATFGIDSNVYRKGVYITMKHSSMNFLRETIYTKIKMVNSLDLCFYLIESR